MFLWEIDRGKWESIQSHLHYIIFDMSRSPSRAVCVRRVLISLSEAYIWHFKKARRLMEKSLFFSPLILTHVVWNTHTHEHVHACVVLAFRERNVLRRSIFLLRSLCFFFFRVLDSLYILHAPKTEALLLRCFFLGISNEWMYVVSVRSVASFFEGCLIIGTEDQRWRVK